ncbi:DNA cytosine methyltransferase [Streptomyces subrutilus]|uniref:DNA (cytosine-5-)-methyltransferase n=1 Tax=Streptomyces subrutilus TaxID=36818 RepID=A0A1E5PU82_9ACTN|nr:DNA cytosine methyltransferase [Streptomyces subrutilus]OEJ33097.1 DNA (cytosine-5-)-methyltransferase [Streptomyces subrutilus]
MERTSVELFAGGGGLVQASTNAGFRHLLVSELAPRACETLEANGFEGYDEGTPSRVLAESTRTPLARGDVRRLDMRFLKEREVDLLAGGPPCQPFSLGGVAKGDEDERNMFPEMFRAVREIRPKAVICENVRGLLRKSFEPYFEYIKRELSLPFLQRADSTWTDHDHALRERIAADDTDPTMSYRVEAFPVNAADYGVPQIRNRVILVAFRSDLKVDWKLFRDEVEETHSEDELINAYHGDAYWRNRTVTVPDHVRADVLDRYPARLPTNAPRTRLPWRTLRDALEGLPEIDLKRLDKKTAQGGVADHVGWPGARIYKGHTPNELDRPAKTVKAGVHGVPGGESVMLLDKREKDPTAPGGFRYAHRYMTVRETARVMTFGDHWLLRGPRSERMRQLGNAVPVQLGEVFANAVRTTLDKAEVKP